MAGTGVGKFSSTAGNNTSNMTVNFAENMAPSNVNNAARELMAHIYDMYKQLGDGYFEYGDGDATYTVARSDADTITITSSSDISSIYFPGRKIRITDGGANVVEGTIASSSHTSTTQTVNLTGISLASGTPTKVELGIDTAAFGGRIILDDDGDSYIEAPTDDTIDFYAGGTKIGTFTTTTVDFNDGVTITVADNSDNLTLTTTDADANSGPNLRLYRNSGSPADDDLIGNIQFEGRNDNSQDVIFAEISSRLNDASDGTEDGLIFVKAMTAGTLTEYMRFDPGSGGIVINDGSADLDFRVESNGNTHMLHVDAGSDIVGIGADPDLGVGLHIKSADSGASVDGSADELVIEGSANTGMSILSGASNSGSIYFGDSGLNYDGYIAYSQANRGFSFGTAGGAKVAISSTGVITHTGGTATSTSDLTTGGIHFHDSSTSAGDIMPITFTPSATADRARAGIGFISQAADGSAGFAADITFYTRSAADGSTLGTSDERLRIDSSGVAMFNTTNSAVAANAVGVVIGDDGYAAFRRGSATVMYLNRFTNDGTLVAFHQAGTEEGSIEVSGSTVSYNGFTGSHWSRLADNSKPTILRGTIMESIDEMCYWYQAVAGEIKEPIALGDKSVGDEITFTSDGTEYTGTIVKEDDVKHNKCKVSDTEDSKKVYGVFSNWDDADDGLDGDVNDMNIAQVGTYIIRVNKDVTVEAGDLLVSNGDGTAKVQDDDIIRSKTVAKVNSNIKVETYSDGSYTVPCTLHC